MVMPIFVLLRGNMRRKMLEARNAHCFYVFHDSIITDFVCLVNIGKTIP